MPVAVCAASGEAQTVVTQTNTNKLVIGVSFITLPAQMYGWFSGVVCRDGVVRLFRNRTLKNRIVTCHLQSQTSGTWTDLFHFSVRQIRQREEQICGGLLVFDRDVAIAAQTAVRPADQDRRGVIAIVHVAVAHSAAKINDSTVE